MKFWLDVKNGGAACHLLATAFKYKSDQGWSVEKQLFYQHLYTFESKF